jgi:diguanylate cyclase (GGDEF)-like protein/PAS domain S-box-containing protein
MTRAHTSGPERLISDLALAAIRDGIVICASDGEIVAVNQSVCDMTGFTADQLIGSRPPLPYWPVEEHAKILDVAAGIGGDGGGEYDLIFRRANGERFPAIASVGISPDDDARVIVIKDITERVALTAALEAAKQEAEAARMAFARSAEVIGELLYSSELFSDEHFVMLAHGPGMAKLLGSDREPADFASAVDRCLHPDDRAGFDREWGYAVLLEADGQIVEQRYRLVGFDGVVRWVLDRARITVIGRRVFMSGAVCDVSAERIAEHERAAAVGRLEWLSSTDSLTELFNRRHFSELLHSRASAGEETSAIALIDIDSFKRINDAYGHSTGDGVLREVSRRLKNATRGSDLIARWGGEEFCVLLGRVRDDADLEARAERLRTAVTSTPVGLPDTPPIAVTVSIGVARALHGRSTDDLFADADVALYDAKRAGRNRTRISRGDRRTSQRAHLRR